MDTKKATANDRRRQRYASDPDYAARRRAENKRWRDSNPVAYAESLRESKARFNRRYASDPKRAWIAKIGWKYGLTPEQYDAMLLEQGGVCAICGGVNQVADKPIRLCIDHCHETGAVRALLCTPCNVGIGLLGDSFARVQVAADYLRKHSEKEVPA